MMGINRVFLLGYLGANPELQTTKLGKPFARLSMATHQRHKNEEGETQTTTQWHRIMVWGQVAELCKNYLQKGSPLAVEGSLSHFTGAREDGSPFSQTSITAHQVHFVGPRIGQDQAEAGEPNP
jgi:single-strand DNA-binding protein